MKFRPGDWVSHYLEPAKPLLVIRGTDVRCRKAPTDPYSVEAPGYALRDTTGALWYLAQAELSLHPRTLMRRARTRRRWARLVRLALLEGMAIALILQGFAFVLWVAWLIVR